MAKNSILDEVEPIGKNCFTCGNRLTWLSAEDPMQLTCKLFRVNITSIMNRKDGKTVCYCKEKGLQYPMIFD